MSKDKKPKSATAQLYASFPALIILAIVMVFATIVYRNNSLGWFVNTKNVSGRGMNAELDTFILPEMSAWRFDLTASMGSGADVDEGADSLNKAGAWVNAIDEDTTTVPKGILPAVVYDGNAHTEHYQFRSLHLGTVDNLLTMSEDNCFYIRFDLTGEALYPANLNYSLLQTGIHVFDQTGNEQTSAIAAVVDTEGHNLEILQKFVRLFNVEAAVSTTEYAPTHEDEKAAIDALFTADGQAGLLENGGDPIAMGDGSEDYYVYLRFSPDLEMCFEATDHIVTYMPCEITFDVTITLQLLD